jgi:hypothetical protein
MFSYNPADKTFNEFTTSEGLQTIDLTAIIADPGGKLWIGASNGLIHLYDPHTRQWNYITDLNSSSATQKAINGFRIQGDTLFILSEVGVSILSRSKMQFGDTYQRFGSSVHQIEGGVLALEIYRGSYYVGTRSGLTSTSLSNDNPSAPEGWLLYDSIPNLVSKAISGFALCSDSLYVGCSSGLLSFGGTAWNLVAGTSGLNILSVAAGYIDSTGAPPVKYPLFVTATDFWSGPGDLSNSVPHIVATVAGATFNSIWFGNTVVLGSKKNGLVLRQDASWKAVVPPGPPSNNFISIVVDNTGVLYSATGYPIGEGIMSYNGTDWKSFTVQSDSRLVDNNFYKISLGSNNSKWAASWGGGVALIDGPGTLRKVLTTNSGLLPTLGTNDDPPQHFVVIGGVAADRQGNNWITNRTPPGDTAMVIFHPDSSLGYLTGLGLRTNPPTIFADVLIDQYNTKWFPNFSRFEGGYNPPAFYFYNENVSISGSSSGWGRLTTDDGLTSNDVWSVALGHDGELWVGTDQGISILFYPQLPHAIAAYHPLPDQVIQQIITDPLNNKWVATKQGVFVLSSDGTSILEHYTVANTGGKLLDDDVASIAIDAKNGTMYFGTEKGLSSFMTAAITPKQTFDNLAISPNPFLLPSSGQLTIEGLVQGSSLKIVTVSGELVREIKTPGGKVGYWDGRNDKGDLVPSGVYLIIAFSEDGNQVTKGKVAVLRK